MSLHTCAENGDLETVIGFVEEYKIDINETKSLKETVLLQKREINEKSQTKCTPLHLASKNGHNDIVKFLLENKADIEAKDKDGKTALQLASAKGHQEIVNHLKSKTRTTPNVCIIL